MCVAWKPTVHRFVRQTQGQDLIEYALLASLVALLIAGSANTLGTGIADWYAALASFKPVNSSNISDAGESAVSNETTREDNNENDEDSNCGVMRIDGSSVTCQ